MTTSPHGPTADGGPGPAPDASDPFGAVFTFAATEPGPGDFGQVHGAPEASHRWAEPAHDADEAVTLWASTGPSSGDPGALLGPSPEGLAPFGRPSSQASTGALATTVTELTATAVSTVPAPRTAVEAETALTPISLPAEARVSRRVSPVIAVAVAAGAVAVGALAAFALTSGSTSTGEEVIAVATAPATGAPSAGPTAVPSPVSSASAGTDAGRGASGALFSPNPRDPFAALVGMPDPASGGAPADGTGADGAAVSQGTQPVIGGASGGTALGSTGSTVTPVGRSGTGTGATGTTGVLGDSPAPTPSPTALSRSQVCSAVTDPMNQVEQLLAGSANGATAAVDAGLALRTPVAVLRTAVSLTSDSRLAGRLDIAASTAEALRAQLIAGTAVTSGQVATQVSRDADVRSACS
ncbi:hypothetical protein FHN55_13310 [Streptomyces sp. NP160]|uniref:hypothetical protein n=1 Tax=Streptomyces sp. NP160 TaxID=2586637 RepID=UPI00111A512B|nr:hypothetical protein [Streptomyces sp. NP160]TNM64502.1 hypothetical protein FHN55_13310 [Streptomyces sp. NP160]